MSFSSTDRSETLRHFIVKALVLYRCREIGHNAVMEFNAGEGIGIFDVFDKTTGIVYEPISQAKTVFIKDKGERYLKFAGVRDIIPIPLNYFSETKPVSYWYKILNSFVVK